MSFVGKHLLRTFSSVNATKKVADDDEEARGACELWVQNLTTNFKKVLRFCCCCCCCFELSVLEHFAEDKKRKERVFSEE